MAVSISGSGGAGRRKSTGERSAVPVADGLSPRKASRAGGVSGEGKTGGRRSGAGGISVTTTSTGRGGRARSIPAVTVPRPRTRRSVTKDVEGSLPGGGEPDLTVLGGVKRDLAEMASRSPALALSGLAMSARALAGELDSESSATSKSMCAKALLDVMDRLRELSPPLAKRDGLDDLASRRAARLAGSSETPGQSRT